MVHTMDVGASLLDDRSMTNYVDLLG